MAERLRPPAFKEGFDKITVVRVKGATPAAGAQPAGEALRGCGTEQERAAEAREDRLRRLMTEEIGWPPRVWSSRM